MQHNAVTTICKSTQDLYDDYIEEDDDEIMMDDGEAEKEPLPRSRRNKRKQKPFTWERYDGIDICLPNTRNSDVNDEQPKAILHFIGGTGLGVFPRQTYAPFLEGLASNNFAVVATPLPVFLSPFDHRAMCADIAEMFQTVYHDVIEDEYGPTAARGIPIVGVGHSLGSRLHVIMNTAMLSSSSSSADDDEQTTDNLIDVAYPREANVLLSFNNYSTSRSVPLLDEMNLIAKGMQRGLEVSKPLQNKIGSKLNEGYQSLRKELEDDSDFDADAEFLLKGLDFLETLPDKATKMFQEDTATRWNRSRRGSSKGRGGAKSRRGRYESTDFFPSPDELWDAIRDEHYAVKKNLFVQFSADKLDQSAKLATAIKSSMGSGDEKGALQNLKYAVLPGGHLTPVVRRQAGGMFLEEDIFQDDAVPSKKANDGAKGGGAVDSKMLDLVRTVVTYVNVKVCNLSQQDEVIV